MKARPVGITKRRPALVPGRLSRVRRVDSVLVAARKGLTHERIAAQLGVSPMRVVLLCDRHGIDVLRAPGPRPRHLVPRPAKRADLREPVPVAGKRRLAEEREEAVRMDRETYGGFVPVLGRMVWRPGKRKVCPAFTTASLYASDTRKPIEYHPPPLVSLGECEPEHKPVVRGERRINPAGHAFGTLTSKRGHKLKNAEKCEEEAAEHSRRLRVARIARGAGVGA